MQFFCPRHRFFRHFFAYVWKGFLRSIILYFGSGPYYGWDSG